MEIELEIQDRQRRIVSGRLPHTYRAGGALKSGHRYRLSPYIPLIPLMPLIPLK